MMKMGCNERARKKWAVSRNDVGRNRTWLGSQNWTLNWAAVGPVEQPRRVAAIPSWQEGANDDYGSPTAARGNRCASRFCDGVSDVGPHWGRGALGDQALRHHGARARRT